MNGNLHQLLNSSQYVDAEQLKAHDLANIETRIVPAYYRQGVAVFRASEIKELLNAGLILQTR